MSVLFRKSPEYQDEIKVASQYFDVVFQRTHCQGELVICRYSALPNYNELEKDLEWLGCTMINSFEEHSFIASFDYYDIIKDYTPKTWFDHNIYLAPEGRYVVKGRTNSKKFQWNTKMYAACKKDALNISGELSNDPYISPQGIIYREYVPLKTFEIGLNGMPMGNEWRAFIYRDKILAVGYYWSIASDEARKRARLNYDGIKLLEATAKLCSQYITFYVVDIAQTEKGNWIIVELNDGQQSGPSECNLDELYKNLKHHTVCDIS